MINAYLAGPIFTERDRMYLDYLADAIKGLWPEVNLYVPHRNTAINDKTKPASSREIYKGDMERLDQTDLLIAVVSGDMPPIGTTCEIGIFSQMQQADSAKHLICLYDDNRDGHATFCQEKIDMLKGEIAENQFHYINLFLVGCIKANGSMYNTSVDLLKAIEKERDFYRDFDKLDEHPAKAVEVNE